MCSDCLTLTASAAVFILALFSLTLALACLLRVAGFGQVIGDNNASIGFSQNLALWSSRYASNH